MEQHKRSKSSTSQLSLGSSFIIPKTTISRTKSATSYVINQKYQQPIVCLHKPKELTGPLNVYNIPELRNALRTYRQNVTNRKKQVDELNSHIFDELELNEYFSNKSNWTQKSKFIKTNSFLSAVQVYLPAKSVKMASFNNFKNLDKKNQTFLPNIYKV
ncbi:unnamed protein product [Brachionus calyciflorus]|uniref:Uncharacterized protein n=1 Tax=Brachionus calyciflorus TaxID=104777 RepID=A0A813ZQH8_9BILA|nr:unnamed protein product [Brachionus calyciflorus]